MVTNKKVIFSYTFAATAVAMLITLNFIPELKHTKNVTLNAKPVKTKKSEIKRIDPLDNLSETFFSQIKSSEPNQECMPIIVESHDKFDIEYQYCSDQALEAYGKERKITENFTVSAKLARKYNFWRSIYSFYSSKQYLMHLSAYPEVVLEIYDTSRHTELSNAKEHYAIRNITRKQKRTYRNLLNKMHKYRDRNFEELTPSMQRVYKLMSHIEDKNKYRIAAKSLRTQRGQRDFIAKGLVESSKYIDLIEEEFAKQGLPKEISKIAFVESSFNLSAKSKVGASGIYQIMPATGKQYLKIRNGIDERNDPVKAARAAAKLLTLNYKLTGKWPLAITAYNHGVGSIKRAVRRTGSTEIEVIIEKYNHRSFGFASQNFYTEFLAILGTLNDAEWLFPEANMKHEFNFTSVKLKSWMSFKKIRSKHKLTTAQIIEFNPDISPWFVKGGGGLPRGFVLKIPVISEDSLEKPLPAS